MPQLHLYVSEEVTAKARQRAGPAECQFPGALLNLLVSIRGSKT
jgi:hypothetical protein